MVAGGGAHALGAVSAASGEGAGRGAGGADQAGMVGALWASRAGTGAAGERLPWGVGAVAAVASDGERTARDRGALRGSSEVLERFREKLEQRQRRERVSLGKVHSEAVRGIERKEGEAYRSGLEGSQERAWAAADGRTVYYNPSIDGYRLSRLVWEERMEQARELHGEGAYERMKRAEERARPPDAALAVSVARSAGTQSAGAGLGRPEPLNRVRVREECARWPLVRG